MEVYPDADAICGTQIGRDRDTALLTIRKDSEAAGNKAEITRDDVEQDLLRINTGHFGLTLIRAESLAKMAKPWFLGVPNADGEWGDGRVDEDIYFWKNFERSGLKLFQANWVRLGHWQDVVTLPDDNLNPVHVYAPDFRKGNLPDGVQW
jgi:hypothetical protein